MKKPAILAIFSALLVLAGCASSQTIEPVESTNSTSAEVSDVPAKKKVCKYDRNSGGGSRLRRVCTYEDAS